MASWTCVKIHGHESGTIRARMRIKGTIDGAQFRSSLIRAGDGDKFVVVNRELRNKISKGRGKWLS
ncbi:MAG TPA: DUF1905 domain-containing protein [Candidatus Nitrosopolaris sp.]|nr:DUF1905 domain-containing protein [Candidatus Nitrosopolaris sp.]